MGKAVRAAFLALLLMELLGFPTVAFADDTDVGRFDKQDALDNASLLLAAMMSNQNFAEYYGISCDVSDDLRMHDALEIYTKSEDGSECLVSGAAVWPVSNSDGLVATIVQFNDREGEVVYKLTSGLNECLGGGSLCFETKLVVDGASEGLSVESVVDCLGLEKKSMRQSNNQTGDIIQVADIAELQILPAQEPHAGSSALRAAYQPQLGLPRIKEPYSMYGWATCVASIAQYLTGSSLAIPYIYDNVHTANTPTNAGKLEVKRGLELHTYPGTATPISAMDWSGSIEDAEIVRWINNGIPFYIVFGQRALYTGLENAVIGGYAYDSSGKIVIIGMDPATGTYVNYSKGSGGTYVTSAGRTWYADSTFVYHFQKPFGGSKWCWLNLQGYKETGWISWNGNWYWADSNGYIVTNNWVQVSGKWYHLGGSGAMDTGWFKSPSSGYWYYLGSDGAARTGWHQLDGYWYVFDSGGAMYRGWYQDGSTWYYLRTASNVPSGGPEGSMLCNGVWTISGKAYRFDSSGACLNP